MKSYKNLLMLVARLRIFPQLSKNAFKAFAKRNDQSREIVKTSHGFKMELSGSDVVENRIWVYREFEPGLTKIIKQLSKSSSIAIDVGCNVGYFSCLIKRYNPKIKLLCIDPNPKVINKCRRNLEINSYDAITIQCALGDKEGIQTLLVPVNNPCLATLGKSVKVRERIDNIEVSVRKLEDIIIQNSINEIGLLKMDTEGYDVKILATLASEWAKRIDNIIFEFSEMRLSQCGSTMEDLFKIQWMENFKMFAIFDDGKTKEIKGVSDWPKKTTETMWLVNKKNINKAASVR